MGEVEVHLYLSRFCCCCCLSILSSMSFLHSVNYFQTDYKIVKRTDKDNNDHYFRFCFGKTIIDDIASIKQIQWTFNIKNSYNNFNYFWFGIALNEWNVEGIIIIIIMSFNICESECHQPTIITITNKPTK